MEEIEESAFSASSVAPKVWKRYVDDRFCINKKDEIRLPQLTYSTVWILRSPLLLNTRTIAKSLFLILKYLAIMAPSMLVFAGNQDTDRY